MKLIVTQAFGDHAKGAEITDPETVAAILADEREAYVVKVADLQPETGPDSP